MVESRSDWCISRQRTWGVPIPVFFEEGTGEALLDAAVIEHVAGVFAAEGTDAWWTRSVEDLLPEPFRSDGKAYVKGTDTMDVWFDSGSSWASVVEERGLPLPVDLYLEGSDQSRGWFQSSLLTSVAATGAAPYKTVLTHGFVLDEKGYKMSKSLGNVVDPAIIINGGANKKQVVAAAAAARGGGGLPRGSQDAEPPPPPSPRVLTTATRAIQGGSTGQNTSVDLSELEARVWTVGH